MMQLFIHTFASVLNIHHLFKRQEKEYQRMSRYGNSGKTKSQTEKTIELNFEQRLASHELIASSIHIK